MKKNITFILGSMGKGGAERVVSILTNSFCEKYDVKIITLLHSEVEYKLDDRIQIIDISNDKKKRIFQLPIWFKELNKYFKNLDKKNSIIISFAARINIVTLIVNLFHKNNIIISERNDPKKDGRSIFVRILVRFLYPISNKVVFQTNYARQLFNKKIQNNSVIIPNPINVPKINNIDIKDNTIVSVGRLEEQKNQKLLITAFKKIHEEFPNYKLIIYGEGNLKEELQNMINKLGLEKIVILPGKVDDVHQKINKAMIFVLSSDYEGQSNALLEAMALGMPCISTNVSGINEVITKENGILINQGDEKQLVYEIRKLICNDSKREEIGIRARETILKMNPDTVILQWQKIIDEIIN